ncbi:tRNA1(Val) (adenine(37)-N6)-methyltransferase [Mucilaginibacter polytrichastri]|uniref:tRNA1(Val) (adenine(37)-N6)-methyltransferase n=1 Tax=Mucilaginibacter polytrichastri TaxID=1302689 RepID=A0A1Q5ZWZ4_9SPHI|nr:methyltransferase [Mucilaginibacter polytrichastri]OKS86238.1 tRNA1(Val) (adenine(37)-N6)-methyltransferase [Mucilaginibacter polytrichastri]SFT16200.1 tRNA1Val (adenine37-N6)-methyltransferase [Mucilaginibacter polytrichastri]
MFQFKQFAVDQSECAMKINTDGVLLGALALANDPKSISDIGTGTGVIALMLAQRFPNGKIDAVEIDKAAAATASSNFKESKFAGRVTGYHLGFEDYFQQNPEQKYDLIVSNPPFYIDSLKSPGEQRTIAKHTDEQFFDILLSTTARQLTGTGLLWLILPVSTSLVVQEIAKGYELYLHTQINIRSYPQSYPHRHIIAFSLTESFTSIGDFTIYDEPKKYTAQYEAALKEFFTIF